MNTQTEDSLHAALILLFDSRTPKEIGKALHRYLVETRPGDLFATLNAIDDERLVTHIYELSTENVVEFAEEALELVLTGTLDEVWAEVRKTNCPDNIYEQMGFVKAEIVDVLQAAGVFKAKNLWEAERI
jgi:hypothetical protein